MLIPFKNKTAGFTLVELLVVISIIGLLSTIVLASLNGARKKGRNAARIQGVQTLVNAFYLSRGTGSMPSSAWACVSATCYEGWASSYTNNPVVYENFLAPHLPNKPVDPSGGSRGYGGFLYINPYTIGSSTGAYIEYLLEPPASCGRAVASVTTANYVQCDLKIE